MSTLKASVVVIVYNQFESVKKVLKGFCLQTVDKDQFEVIVIDDGSTDGLEKFMESDIPELTNLYIVHTPNQGRAAGRNYGANLAKGELLIFCDGDRVPGPDFVEEYIKLFGKGYDAVIGASYDYFGRPEVLEQAEIDWKAVEKYSRLPSYFKRITQIFDENGDTESDIVWLSFLIGNACIRKDKFDEVNGFDEKFREWGFEHFDLGFRLYEAGCRFGLNMKAKNFHIPHSREKDFYKTMLLKNIDFFKEIHKDVDTDLMQGLLLDNKKLEELGY